MLDAIFKIIIFGDAGCGKTTLTKRFKTEVFISDSQMTIGVDFETKTFKVDGKKVKLMIWEFGGGGRFHFILPEYLTGAMGGILMYDITNYSSFSHLSNWFSIINETNQKFPIILLGGKVDLDDYREISFKDGMRTAKSMGLNEFIECSSKTGENVTNAFEVLTRIMLDKMSFKNRTVQSITT